MGRTRERAAILDGAEQITIPTFVSTLCICIVFVPMFFLEGVPRFLFVPMALAVMFAMVRRQVRLEARVGLLPEGKWSVTMDRFAGGSSIAIGFTLWPWLLGSWQRQSLALLARHIREPALRAAV